MKYFQIQNPKVIKMFQVMSVQIGENDDMFDRLAELGEPGDNENNFVTVSDDNTIDISHVSFTESCLQKQKQVNYLNKCENKEVRALEGFV